MVPEVNQTIKHVVIQEQPGMKPRKSKGGKKKTDVVSESDPFSRCILLQFSVLSCSFFNYSIVSSSSSVPSPDPLIALLFSIV